MVSVPLNDHLLTALVDGPQSLVDLRRAVGSPPQTTMRGNLRTLTAIGVVARHRHAQFPGTVDYELTAPGRRLLEVRDVLRIWLRMAPDGPIAIASVAAKSAVKALLDAWSATMVRALAARALSLTDLNRLIAAHNYPSLERRLVAMRLSGLVDPLPGQSRRTPYAVNRWLRLASAPLAAAARWERRHLADQAPPMGRIDVEALFLLAVPLLSFGPDTSGCCRLVAEVHDLGGEKLLAGVQVEVRDGEVVSCVSRLEGEVNAWVSGSTSTWLRAILGQEADRLEVAGDITLAQALVSRLHGTLFAVEQGA